MDIFATDEIYIVNALALTYETCIVNNVARIGNIKLISVTNEQSITEPIVINKDFNPSKERIESFRLGVDTSGIFSFTDKKKAEQAFAIILNKELKQEEKQLDEYKTLFHESFDRVLSIQNKLNSLKL